MPWPEEPSALVGERVVGHRCDPGLGVLEGVGIGLGGECEDGGRVRDRVGGLVAVVPREVAPGDGVASSGEGCCDRPAAEIPALAAYVQGDPIGTQSLGLATRMELLDRVGDGG